jgi:DNA-binding MarR family transcriptional regulator
VADACSDPRITAFGMLLEAHAAVVAAVNRDLERDSGMPVSWFEVLIRLARSPGHRLRMSDLAMQTSLTPSGLTRAVDRLEEAGLVERVACPSDRRGAFAALTEAGLDRITAAVGPHLRHVEEHLTGVLAADEQRDLARLLRKVRDHVNPEAAVVTPAPDDEAVA